MPTAMTDSLHFACIKDALEDISICNEPGWMLILLLASPVAKIALFCSTDSTQARKIHFHSLCCGVVKSGWWQLEGSASPGDIKQLETHARELILEFQRDSVTEREVLTATAKESGYESNYFCQ